MFMPLLEHIGRFNFRQSAPLQAHSGPARVQPTLPLYLKKSIAKLDYSVLLADTFQAFIEKQGNKYASLF